MTMIPAGALIRNREVPELGPGRLVAELEDGAATVMFENSDDVREVRLAHADIVRQPLMPGTRVRVQRGDDVDQGEVVATDWPESARGLCAYTVRMGAGEETVFESQVTPVAPASDDPRDQFGALHWRGPFRFFSRWDMHRVISQWYEDSEGLPTAIGARIVPQPHHAHAMRQVLWASAERHILADEDAQSRLYEAGLIVQSLYAADPHLRVLVVAPGRRTHRWKADMELRFGNRSFMRLDASHLAANPEQRWSSVSDSQRLVVSQSCFQQKPRACSELIVGAGWDVVIIDEAHRLGPRDPAFDSLVNASEDAARFLMLGAVPERLDVEELTTMLGLLDPQRYRSDDPAAVDARVDELSPIWDVLNRADELLGQDVGETDTDATATHLAEQFDELIDDDPFVAQRVAALEDGHSDQMVELTDHLRSHYRLDGRLVRSRRDRLDAYNVSWNQRTVEVVEYQPDEAETKLIDHLANLPPESPGSPRQLALRGLYYNAAASGPNRLFSLLEDRLDALETTAGDADGDSRPFDLLGLDLGPREEIMLSDQVVAGAPPLDGEGEWVAEAMSLVAQWHAESSQACARYKAAAQWVASFFDGADGADESGEPRKVVVACKAEATALEVADYLDSDLDSAHAEAATTQLEADQLDEVVGRFRDHDARRVLVCDEAGAVGREITAGAAIVHLDQPWMPSRVERRISWLDQPHRDVDAPVHSVVLCGPGPIESHLGQLYNDVLDIYGQSVQPAGFAVAQIDRDVWMAGCAGPEAIAGLVTRVRDRWRDPADRCDRDRGYRASLDGPTARLEADAEFSELLDFIDGVADSLPIRHWARMLGIEDESSASDAFQFKWHWKNVQRGLAGFDVDPDDVDLLMPQQQVEMRSGTFRRKQALDHELLEFFAPGHKFIDALIEDATNPTDGRTSVFARRLGPAHRGEVYLNVVAKAHLDAACWEGMYMPEGLINRAYRHLWPESVSVPVQFDLKARRDPTVVDDRQLIQKLEQSYQGPEADQKIEYELFIHAIEDVARFRDNLVKVVDVGLDRLREDRSGLVEGGVAALKDDLESEMAFLAAQRDRADSAEAGRAAYQLELREKLIEAVGGEKLELDALAVVVAGPPQVLR